MTFPENKLVIAEGDSLRLTVSIQEGEDPKDLSGSTLFFTIKKSPQDNDRDALLRVVSPHIPDHPAGVIPVTASATQMKRIREGAYYYDLRIVKSGVVTTLAAASPIEVVATLSNNLQA